MNDKNEWTIKWYRQLILVEVILVIYNWVYERITLNVLVGVENDIRYWMFLLWKDEWNIRIQPINGKLRCLIRKRK